MKAQIDENLPPALARAIDPIARVDDHEVVHVRDFVGSGTKDVALFEEAIQQGIQVHVTQDHHHRRPVEREAIARLGLTVFVLAKGWRHVEPLRLRSPAAGVVAEDDAAGPAHPARGHVQGAAPAGVAGKVDSHQTDTLTAVARVGEAKPGRARRYSNQVE